MCCYGPPKWGSKGRLKRCADECCARYVNADHWDGFRNFMIHNT